MLSHFLELRTNSPGFNRHHDSLNRPDFVVRNALFPGDAKVVFHSRVACDRHGRCQVDHQGGFWIEDLVVPS